jgi:hypothetical protein
MGNSIAFFSGSSDTEAFQDFAASLGLHLVPMTVDKKVVPAPADGPFCYLSLVPISELHPYGEPRKQITEAKDPMLGFMRAYFKNPYLVLGHLHWSDDVAALATQTKPYYQKLRNWIKHEWESYGDVYIGPEAKELIEKGAQMVNALPGQAALHVIKI